MKPCSAFDITQNAVQVIDLQLRDNHKAKSRFELRPQSIFVSFFKFLVIMFASINKWQQPGSLIMFSRENFRFEFML